MPTKQPGEVGEAILAPEERSVRFESIAAVSKSCSERSFADPYVKVPTEEHEPRKQEEKRKNHEECG
jgi:hypothetical protein